MFIRPCYRRKNGKRHAYWALMESYRTQRGPRQRIVAYLGQLDESHRLGVKNATEGNPPTRQTQLFDDTWPHWVEVDVKRMRVENRRDFGGPWLGLQLVERTAYRRAFLRPECADRSAGHCDGEDQRAASLSRVGRDSAA
jgi:hypothetical protein